MMNNRNRWFGFSKSFMKLIIVLLLYYFRVNVEVRQWNRPNSKKSILFNHRYFFLLKIIDGNLKISINIWRKLCDWFSISVLVEIWRYRDFFRKYSFFSFKLYHEICHNSFGSQQKSFVSLWGWNNIFRFLVEIFHGRKLFEYRYTHSCVHVAQESQRYSNFTAFFRTELFIFRQVY